MKCGRIDASKLFSRRAGISYLQILILILGSFAFSYIIYESSKISDNVIVNKKISSKSSEKSSFIEEIMKMLAKPMIQEVSAQSALNCCPKTKLNDTCLDFASTDCQSQCSQQCVASQCKDFSDCQPGCCYDSKEGICSANTAKTTCTASGGVWKDSADCNLNSVPECRLGCCVLGDNVQFVTGQRCAKLAGDMSLNVDFRAGITDEGSCLLLSIGSNKGACVLKDYSCKMLTNDECRTLTGKNIAQGYLCTAAALKTSCKMTTDTMCVDGKDEVYFVDTCGNPANIYDASKVSNQSYWEKTTGKFSSCGALDSKGNINSPVCGNCDRYTGSSCKSYQDAGTAKPDSGNFVCADLSCKNAPSLVDAGGKILATKNRKNGESWCIYDSKIGGGDDIPGSRQFKYLCTDGQIEKEPCADARNEICVESTIAKNMSNAVCRANNWRNCFTTNVTDCNNVLDCYNSSLVIDKFRVDLCMPNYPPGFGKDEANQKSAQDICNQATKTCIVKYASEGFPFPKCVCVQNCQCMAASFTQSMNDVCRKLGDCGGEANIAGVYTENYKVSGAPKLSQSWITTKLISLAKVVPGLVASPGDVSVQLEEAGINSQSIGQIKGYAGITQSDLWNQLTSFKLSSSSSSSSVTGSVIAPVTGDQVLSTESGTTRDPLPYEGVTYEGGTSATATILSEPGINPGVSLGEQLGIAGELPPPVPGIAQAGSGGMNPTRFWDVYEATHPDFISGAGGAAGGSSGGTTGGAAGGGGGSGGTGGGATGAGTAAIGGFIGGVVGGILGGILGSKLAQALGLNPTGTFLMSTGMGLIGASTLGAVGTSIASNGAISFVSAMGSPIFGPAILPFLNPFTIAIIGAIMVIASFFFMGNNCPPKQVTFTCMPWQAPIGGKDCAKCNNGEKPCSKYRCESLGQACQLLNEGTGNDTCVTAKDDGKSPVITPWLGILGANFTYSNISSSGFQIREKDGGCIQSFTPVIFGLNTDKVAQCKIDLVPTDKLDDMQEYFGGSNLFVYNHSQTFSMPSVESLIDYVNGTNQSAQYIINKLGNLKLYVRCQDMFGNYNPAEYLIDICIKAGPDMTPPYIAATDPANGELLKNNQTSQNVNIFVNEPASCRYSSQDKNYDDMENNFSCETDLGMQQAFGWQCNSTFSKLVNGENNFYIRCKDQPWLQGTSNESKRNPDTQSYQYKLVVSETPLVITSLLPNGTVSVGSEPAVVSLNANTAGGAENGKAVCSYNWGGSWIVFLNTVSASHSQPGLNLLEGDYNIPVKCEDSAGNVDEKTASFSINVDSNPPGIVRVYNSQGSLYLFTNENSECAYSATNCNFIFENGTQMQGGFSQEHSAEWDTSRTYYIKCRDMWNNEPNGCSIKVRGYTEG